jgi:hypothetical protein
MTANPNIHTLIMYNVPLAVACLDCGHRSLISPHLLATRRLLHGTMTPIRALRLRCGECKGKNVRKEMPRDMAEAGRFICTAETA